VADTVWGDVAPLAVSVDFTALEAGFAARAAPKPQLYAASGAPAAGAPRLPVRASLLPLQRANNVGIVLTRLRITPAQVSAVALLDLEALWFGAHARTHWSATAVAASPFASVCKHDCGR
jgi:hypothetical protein